MSDAKLLAPVMDGVIVVVGAGVSTVGMMRRCLLEMQHSGANVLGIVMNRVKPARGGYLRRNIEDYRNYRDDDDRASGNGNGRAAARAGKDGELPMILLVDDRETRDSENA